MSTIATELRALWRLATPIITVQLGLMAMSIVDVAMVGHLSAEALAGVGLGNSYAFVTGNFGVGVLMSLDPLVSQAHGARDDQAVRRAVHRSCVLAVLLSIPVALIFWMGDSGLTLLRQRPTLIPDAQDYLLALIPGLPAFYLFIALRQTLQALHVVRPIVITILLANIANAVLDYGLIHGSLGMPRLGIEGCGLATSACRWLTLGLALLFGWPAIGPALRGPWRDSLEPRKLLRVFALGAPIGIQGTIEAGTFASIAFLMGWLGADELAGHTVTLHYAALAFMVPLGIASAAAVRVGFGVGRRDQAAVRRSARIALSCGAGVMLVSAIVFVVIPGPLAHLFTTDAHAAAIAASLLPIAALFQVFDGVQVVASGVLRGIGDVRFPMLIHLGGFWLAGLPLSYYLAFEVGVGPRGLWWGLVLGLALVAIVLVWRVFVRLRHSIERVEPPIKPAR